jgi:F0F1-type ATP synthase membrane subunit b/b'
LGRAREKLEAEVVDRAIEIAQGIIQEQLSDDDHHRLTTDYFANLEDSLRS